MVIHKVNMIGKKFNRLTVIAYADDYISPRDVKGRYIRKAS